MRGGRSESCFNPHPPRTTGATPTAAWKDINGISVSILTRRERRAQRVVVRQGDEIDEVSILTRRERRAQHENALTIHDSCVFQSSPAANDGRNWAEIEPVLMEIAFQSSPAANDGRN